MSYDAAYSRQLVDRTHAAANAAALTEIDCANQLSRADEEISRLNKAIAQFKTELATMPNITTSTPESKLLHGAILDRANQLFP